MSPEPVAAAPLPPVRRRHLEELSAFGPIAQHAIGTRPDPAHGTCIDDVARALEVDLAHGAVIGWAAVEASAWANLSYLDQGLNEDTGRFRNFRSMDGTWLDAIGSEDAHGRAVLALGRAMAGAQDRRFRDEAARILARALRGARSLVALRAQSAALIGCVLADGIERTGADARDCRATGLELASSIRGVIEPVAASATWPFPEAVVTYEAAIMPRAMIVAGDWMGDAGLVGSGLAVLDWLSRTATAERGHLSPVGNRGWWPRGGSPARFDQQPLEAAALLQASEAAMLATGDPSHLADAERAFGWYLGANDLGLAIADPERGGCRDGLRPDGCNENQGAESTLAWLIAVERLRAMRAWRPAAGGGEPTTAGTRGPRVAVSEASGTP